MAWRFQKRIKIAPGVRLNISKSAVSMTAGPKGASVNIGKNGSFVNAGLPGTGLSTRTKIGPQTDKPSPVTSEAPQPGRRSAILAYVLGFAVVGGIILVIL